MSRLAAFREAARGRCLSRLLPALILLAMSMLGVVQIGRGLYVPAKAVVAQVLLERAFARSLADHRPEKPWAWADMTPLARLSVPRLGESTVVLDTGSGQAMAFGPTLLPGGVRIGRPGTAILAAHRDTHFSFLKDVRPGDVIVLQTREGLIRRYRVTGADVVRWDGYAAPDATMGERLDLVTCYPFAAIRHGPWRYVLHAAAIGK